MLQKTVFEYANKSSYSAAGTDYFGFSFGCAREPVDGKIELVNSTHTCREGLMANMRTRITGASTAQPTDKTRMIFFWKASNVNKIKDQELIDGWINRAIPIIQAFDRLAGWPITRVYKVDCGQDYVNAYYFHSSRRWMKSSYLISLYVMLVRMCKDKRITGFKDFKGLVKLMETLTVKAPFLVVDQAYVEASFPYWEAIMRGYPRLFRRRKIQYYWDTTRLGESAGSYEGLQYLVKGDTRYKEVRNELLVIKNELDEKTFKPTKKKEA